MIAQLAKRFLALSPAIMPAARDLGIALKTAYPEDHEADCAMQRMIEKLGEIEDMPTLVGIATTYKQA